MARRGAAPLALPLGPGGPRGGGGGKLGLGNARSTLHTVVAWCANTALALTAGSAVVASGLGAWIGWVASGPVWLLTHGAALIPDVPLLPLDNAMAVVVFLMFAAIVCDVVDGKVDQPAVSCLILLGSFGTAAAGFPAEWASWITGGVADLTITPVADFFGG